MPKVMFISYYFPPCGAGWVMRMVNFIRHLPHWGWSSVVLTVKQEYYKDNATPDSSLLEGLPSDLLVVRTNSLEPKAKLKTVEPKEEFIPGAARPSLLTRLLVWLEKAVFIPDVKILWLPVALWRGRKIVKSEGVDLLFVSAPDFSLLLIAYCLKRLTACPLVLDLRDDWDDNPYYRQPYWYGRKLVTYWERKVVTAADKVILVTERSREGFCRRYPQQQPEKFVFLPNGYDPKIEEIMAAKPLIPSNDEIEKSRKLDGKVKSFSCKARKSEGTRRTRSYAAVTEDVAQHSRWTFYEAGNSFTIVHSGMLPPERVTPALFWALKELFEEQPDLRAEIKLVFWGNVCNYLRQLVEELGLSRQVEFGGTLPYEQNIRQMAQAGLLLLIPSLGIPNSLPGKVYEYLAVHRPFLALTEDNVTRDFLGNLKHKYTYYPDDKQGIKEAILYFYQRFRRGKLESWPALPGVEKYNRAEQTRQLARILDEVVGDGNA